MEGSVLGTIIGLIIATLLNAVVLWIVGKMGVGMVIEKFGTAFVAAFLLALIGVLLTRLTGGWFAGSNSAIMGTIVHIVVSAIILLIVDKILPGMQTKGFLGAIIAAIAIGLVAWLISLVVSGLMK
jgi:putative membrane protein